jgi:VWFA-related protein
VPVRTFLIANKPCSDKSDGATHVVSTAALHPLQKRPLDILVVKDYSSTLERLLEWRQSEKRARPVQARDIMRVKLAVIAITLCLAGAEIGFAQSVPPPPALPTPSPQSAVHVTTRVVQVSVTVQDVNGKPVKGLTKDDFVLLDGGKPQHIPSTSEGTRGFTGTGASADPNHFTNVLAAGNGAAPPLTVIVLDVYNTWYHDYYWRPGPPDYPCLPLHCPPPLMGTLFTQVEKFIGQMQPQDRVAIYQLNDQLDLLQDFTNDPSALQRGLDRGKKTAGTQTYLTCAQNDQAQMSNRTMVAMDLIADRLRRIPGRKNLIWLSTGFPFRKVTTTAKMDSTAETLGDRDLPLFAIDADGLAAPLGGGGGPVPQAGARGPSADMGPTPSQIGNGDGFICPSAPGVFNAVKNLSEMSGGRAFSNTNDFAGAIRQVIDDSSASYVLDYYPDHNNWNGEFREIKVRVNRPGVEVHARRGYFAVIDNATGPENDAERVADALQIPAETTDLAFDVQVEAIAGSGARQLKLKIILDPNQLRFRPQDGRWTDNITEYSAQFDSEGQQLGTNSQTINLKPSPDAYKLLLFKGLSFSETVQVENNATELRLVLRDAGNGVIGSVMIPLSRFFAPPTVAQSQTKQ